VDGALDHVIGWAPFAIYVGQGAVATLAWKVARRRVYHRPLALYLVLLAVTDALRGLLHLLVLDPARAALGPVPPFEGALRGLWHLDQALFLALPVGLALTALRLFGVAIVPLVHVVGAAGFGEAVLAVGYPTLRGKLLGMIYVGVALACQGVTWGAVIRWLTRDRGTWPLPTETLLVLYAGADLALLLGPKAFGDIFAAWPLANGSYLALQVVSVAFHLAWLRGMPPLSAGRGR